MMMHHTQQRPDSFDVTDFRTILNIAQTIMRLLSTTLEVFWRSGFGERYFDFWLYFLMGGLCYGAFLMAVTLLSLFTARASGGPLLNLFFLAVLVMGALHSFEIRARRKRGVTVHSRYSGTSHGFWYVLDPVYRVLFRKRLTQDTIQLWFEPASSYFIASLAEPISPALSLYVTVAALSMHFSRRIEISRARHQLLDIIDAQLEAEYIEEAIKDERTPEKRHGFTMPGCADLADKIDFTALRDRLTQARAQAKTSANSPANAPDTGATDNNAPDQADDKEDDAAAQDAGAPPDAPDEHPPGFPIVSPPANGHAQARAKPKTQVQPFSFPTAPFRRSIVQTQARTPRRRQKQTGAVVALPNPPLSRPPQGGFFFVPQGRNVYGRLEGRRNAPCCNR